MKRVVFFASICSIFFIAVGMAPTYGQRTDISNTVQLPTSRDVVEERLIKMAWEKHPSNKAIVYRSQIAEDHLSKTKWTWLENFRVQGNLNEFTMQPDRYVRSAFFPRYNFSLGFSIGEFVTTPYEVKKMRGEYEISKLDIESQKLLVRTEVLKRYNRYVSARDQVNIQKRLESETKLNLDLMKSRFDKGEESYLNYSALMERHYNIQIRTKELEELQEEAKVDLEAMINTNLESVL